MLTSSPVDNSSDAANPSCATVSYLGSPYSGYTVPICSTEATTILVYYYSFDAEGGSITTPISTSTTTTSTTTSTTTTTTPTPTPTTPTPTPVPTPSTPVGAIVGGVVGGIGKIIHQELNLLYRCGDNYKLTFFNPLAGLALIGALVFFLLRRHEKKKAQDPGPPQPFVSQYQPPAVDQTPQGHGPSYGQMNRSSVAKSPVTMATATTSPAPGYQYQPSFDGTNMSTSPAQGYPPGYNTGQPVEPQRQQSWSVSPEPSTRHEMPVWKPERLPQEMPGSP